MLLAQWLNMLLLVVQRSSIAVGEYNFLTFFLTGLDLSSVYDTLNLNGLNGLFCTKIICNFLTRCIFLQPSKFSLMHV